MALKLSLLREWLGYIPLGASLGLSLSEVHAAVRRLGESRLFDEETKQVRRRPLLEFIVHGLPYVYPASPKEVTRGVPTAWAAPILASTTLGQISSGDDLPPVWPHPDGKVRGRAIKPLYISVPDAVRKDPELYALLALADAVRVGRARERKMAQFELEKRLISHGAA